MDILLIKLISGVSVIDFISFCTLVGVAAATATGNSTVTYVLRGIAIAFFILFGILISILIWRMLHYKTNNELMADRYKKSQGRENGFCLKYFQNLSDRILTRICIGLVMTSVIFISVGIVVEAAANQLTVLYIFSGISIIIFLLFLTTFYILVSRFPFPKGKNISIRDICKIIFC